MTVMDGGSCCANRNCASLKSRGQKKNFQTSEKATFLTLYLDIRSKGFMYHYLAFSLDGQFEREAQSS